MRPSVLRYIATSLFSLSLGSESVAQVVIIFQQRQEERRASRWTLADWLKTKRTIEAQNIWLAAHTNKFPLDFTLTTEATRYHAAVEGDVYYGRLGLKARYQKAARPFEVGAPSNDPRATTQNYALQLRLMGGNIQDTNLIVRGFYESQELLGFGSNNGHYRGFGVAPELQIYFAKWLGVRGDWAYRFARPLHENQTVRQSGNSWSAVAFLEFGPLRFEVGQESRVWKFDNALVPASSTSLEERSLIARMRLFY